MSEVEQVDIGHLRLSRESDISAFHRFVGAIEAAARLGRDVKLRVLDDYFFDKRNQQIPLDVIAYVEG